MVTTRSKVISRSHHDVAQVRPLSNVPTKYKLPIPYRFRDIAQIPFIFKSIAHEKKKEKLYYTSFSTSHLYGRR